MSFLPFLGRIASSIITNPSVQGGVSDLISGTQEGLKAGQGFFPSLGQGLKKGFSTFFGINGDDKPLAIKDNAGKKIQPTPDVFQITNASEAGKVFKKQLNGFADAIEEDTGKSPTKKDLQKFKKIILSEDADDYLPFLGDDEDTLSKKIDWAIDFFMKKDMAPPKDLKYPRALRFKRPVRITV